MLIYFISAVTNHLGCRLAKNEQLHGKWHPFILRSRKRIELISCLQKWSRSWFQNDRDRENGNSRTVKYNCLCEYQLLKDVTFLSIPQRDGGVSGVRYKFYLNIIMPRKSYITIILSFMTHNLWVIPINNNLNVTFIQWYEHSFKLGVEWCQWYRR